MINYIKGKLGLKHIHYVKLNILLRPYMPMYCTICNERLR